MLQSCTVKCYIRCYRVKITSSFNLLLKTLEYTHVSLIFLCNIKLTVRQQMLYDIIATLE